MIGFLYFLLMLIAILMAVRLLPAAFFIGGCLWLWHSHTWVLILAIVIGAVIGVWRSLSNRDELTIHSRASTGLPTGHGLRRRIRRG
jgi:uncharacterized membrane protein YadS